ncbi:MAG: nucleic acid binding-protein [Cenarchaeum symbiont of Oopsacas minuta]|nr:nucleic acid binding-protein [Cenarchaeum symbiont of Oopsacas minuta]
MSEYEDLVSRILEQKPDLTRESLNDMIKQKKDTIGKGYLQDKGALYLLAADFKISMGESANKDMNIKDIFSGATNVSLETRVLNVAKPRQFSRKDGSEFLLRTMTVYDNGGTASVKLWDEKANLPGIETLKPGDLVRIIKAHVKSDQSGAPTINISSGSSIEPSDSQSDIRGIDSMIINVGMIKEHEKKDLVVTGTVDGLISTINFTNSRGQPGKGLKMRLKGNDESIMRIVVWGQDEKNLPPVIAQGSVAKLIGVRTKESNQGGLELHGNEGTSIEIEGSHDIQPITARIISISKTDAGKRMVLCVDEKKSMIKLSDTSALTDQFLPGDVIECMPSRIYGNSIMLDSSSFVRKVDDTSTMPKNEDLRTLISDIKLGDDSCCIEAIILRIPDIRSVQTKNGDSIELAEMLVEDESGEIWVKGWRNQARIIGSSTQGEIVFISDVGARAGLEDKIELSLSPFSTITRKT